MAGGGKRGGGDRILESRHLVGLFLGVVLLCGVFFTLGYVMGRTQYDGAVHAATAAESSAPVARPAAKPKVSEAPPAAAPVPSPGEWDFYTKKDDNHLEPASKPSSPPAISTSPAASASVKSPAPVAKNTPAAARLQPPRVSRGSIVLQVAALSHQSDALALADALQQKGFPSFVVTPTGDGFYRVQVGPYPSERSAESARAGLEHAGFKAIVKR